ncbi:MAG: NUDIX hydrolase [Rhodobacteraceae bacterium]|nr:NUDIX hydrolase [Paracoccaceae bacterium]
MPEASRLAPTAAAPAIRDAATLILCRNSEAPEVLMGQRGAGAAFMPSKFVFPGGAVDPDDATVPLAGLPSPICMARLSQDAEPGIGPALIAAGLRELCEETGLILGAPVPWPDPPEGWHPFAARGLRPSGAGLRFIFRAITPPGRPRRFDARFFLADAAAIHGDPEDFSAASGELSSLQWIPISEIRSFDLPFITEVVLAEVAALVRRPGPPESVPFFCNDDEESLFLRLRGATQEHDQ